MGSTMQVGLSPEQLQARRSGVGASEVGAILGLDRYKSPLDVWAEKTGQRALEWAPASQAAKMGHLLEPVVAALAEEHYAAAYDPHAVVLTTSDTRVGREPWQRATPDRICTVLDQGGAVDTFLVECKTKSWNTYKAFGAPGTDQVPDTIALQALWQMDVMGCTRCDVAVLVDGREFALYPIAFDAALAADVFERVRDWWTVHVVGGVEPAPARGSDVRYLREKFTAATADLLSCTHDVEQAVRALAEAKAAKEQAEQAEELAKARVMHLLGEHKGVHTPWGKVSWSDVKGRTTTNWKGIAEIMGAPDELIQQHTSTGAPSRQFRFYAAKES